jgi:1-acyl-sn-glycerol-3-phosphate acyltransferase
MLTALSRGLVRAFFREVAVEGREHLPGFGPVILAVNHPNALIDPLLLLFLSPPFRLRFIAKAPLFQVKGLGRLMRAMNAIPVVRRPDGAGHIDHRAFFAQCVDALAEGDVIVIFPEGISLPQPHMAPLKTGVARLHFLAGERGIEVPIVPVGLNYERGERFRSAVAVSIGPPIDTEPYREEYETDPKRTVRALTDAVTSALAERIVQLETFRDRDLMLLLERLYADEKGGETWTERLARLKTFEAGFEELRGRHPEEIERLRQLLERYERLSMTFGVWESASQRSPGDPWRFAIATVGWLLNRLPYKLSGSLVRLTRRDESHTALYKLLYGLLLFPLTYALEGAVVGVMWGSAAVTAYALGILPLSFFSLRFFDRREDLLARLMSPSLWLLGRQSRRASQLLGRLRERIVRHVEEFAARLETGGEVR